MYITLFKLLFTPSNSFSFVKWLRRKTPQPGTQMDAALKYIRMRTRGGGSRCGGPYYIHPCGPHSRPASQPGS